MKKVKEINQNQGFSELSSKEKRTTVGGAAMTQGSYWMSVFVEYFAPKKRNW